MKYRLTGDVCGNISHMNAKLQYYISRIESSKNLPTLPHILVNLIHACENENSSIRDVAKIIRADASISAKIIKLVNSSYYRSAAKISQIDHALIRLGRNAIKNLAISSAVQQVFNKPDALAAGFDLKRFWRHSLTSAILARMIAEKTGYNLPEQAFLAGMIHDIGRLILAVNFPEEYETVLQGPNGTPESLLAAETRMGATHTEIGEWILTRWNIDSMIIDALRYHHEPAGRIQNAFPLTRIVHAANDMSRASGINDAAFGVLKGLFPCAFSDTVDMVVQAEEEVHSLAGFLGFSIGEKAKGSFPDQTSPLSSPEFVRTVKDHSLLVGVLQNLLSCRDENAILKAIQESLSILFDFRNLLFFLIDPEDGLLKAKALDDAGHIDSPPGLIVSLHNRESVIIQSLQRNAPLVSENNGSVSNLPILDEQILHLLECGRFLCLPLICTGEKIGVIVVALDDQTVGIPSREEKLLNLFAGQAAAALYVEQMKRLQIKRIAEERLAATTDVARKVVHEANNPLNIMKNYLRILSSRLEEQDPAQNEIHIIEEEIDRVSRILKELSDFSKPRSPKMGILDLNGLLKGIVKIVSRSLPPELDVQFHTNLAQALPPIRSDRDALKQIFINLIKNAVEALAGHGNIYIETFFVPMGPESGQAGNDLHSRGHAKIVVSDDGPGLSPGIQERLFEPYSSTKGKGHSGIGLSVVYKMVKELGGTVTAGNVPNEGAVFTVTLPVNSPRPS